MALGLSARNLVCSECSCSSTCTTPQFQFSECVCMQAMYVLFMENVSKIYINSFRQKGWHIKVLLSLHQYGPISELYLWEISFVSFRVLIDKHFFCTAKTIFICPDQIKKENSICYSAVWLTKAKALSTGIRPGLIGPPSLKMDRTSSGSRKDSLYQLSNPATQNRRNVSVGVTENIRN